MSRIIRGVQAEQINQKQIEIHLRDLFVPQALVEVEQVEQEPTFTKQELMEERNRMLEDARSQIEEERRQFDHYQQEQLQALEQLKQMWQEEKLQLEQEAYNKAFSEGYEEGIQKASASMEQTLKMVNQSVIFSEQNAEKYLHDQEYVILDLAMQSAEKIIGETLPENRELYASIVKQALKEVREQENIRIFVAAEYYELISNYRDELAEMFPPNVQFLIFVNEELSSLESYIETNHGRVIVSIDSQLSQLREKLTEILDSKE